MKRVMIIGQPGSGKSTLARALGARTGLPVEHIDHIHWKPGWIARDNLEKTVLCRKIHQRDRWIFEGGHSTTWPQRLQRCDTIIWLDVPFLHRAWRVVRRTLRNYGQTRPDLPENCPERFNPEFYQWIWNTRHTARAKMSTLFEGADAGKRRIKLSTPHQVTEFLDKWDISSQEEH